MKACSTCLGGLTARDDDGTGKHVTCPVSIGREAYLRERARRMPKLVELQERQRQDPDYIDTGS